MKVTNRTSEAGFSIVELMVSMVVAMILAAVAVPGFLSWLPGLRLSGAALQVANDLQLARMKAITQNTSYTVSFNVSAGTYSFGTDSRSLKSLYPGINIASVAPSNPVFSARGTASAITITISNGDKQKLVCVKAMGRVNVAENSCS
jgi:Tfp pilus assembly protein FimT